MKNRVRGNFAFKILCVILALISLTSTVIGLAATIWLTEIGAWQFSQEKTIETQMNNYMYQDIYAALSYHGLDDSDYVSAYSTFNRDSRVNFRYEILTYDGDLIATNIDDETIKTKNSYSLSDEYSSAVINDSLMTDDLDWASKNSRGEIDSSVPPDGDEPNGYSRYEVYDVSDGFAYYTETVNNVTVNAYLKYELEKGDRYYYTSDLIERLYPESIFIISMTVVSLFLFILFMVMVCSTAAVRADSEELRPSRADRFPFDLALLLLTAVVTAQAALFIWVSNYFSAEIEVITAVLVTFVLLDELLLVIYVKGVAARVKTSSFFSTMLIVRFFKFIGRKIKASFQKTAYKIRNLKFVKKTVLSVSGILLFDLIICAASGFSAKTAYVTAFIELLVLVPLIISLAIQFRKIEEGVNNIVNGDFSFKIDTKYMFGDFKRMADALNGINVGMQKAVDEKMKSERFKTELITNVSHDLKTPLTSIINYVDLIKKEDVDNETVKEYIGVLDRQSSRLKKLIEDLIEASKASTGNIQVNFAPCDAGILLSQAVAEYTERAQKSDLELVVTTDNESHYIMADSRLLWRVYDNLLSNICKYAFPGTRVYLSVRTVGNRVVTVFKNISKAKLNISSDELMERFVRGDSSRNTEGSGLGLSIVKSLTALQKGEIKVSIDGDMFTTSVSFDLLTRTESPVLNSEQAPVPAIVRADG